MKGGIFLDRDGVINEVLNHRVKFVNQPSDFYLLDGVAEAIKHFNDARLKVFVVTNQGGVGLGYMKESTLNAVHEKMNKDLAAFGTSVTAIAYCPHKPQDACRCRKPQPEMLLKLAKKYRVDLQKSYMVGDRKSDVEAGKNAGTKTVLVGNRKEQVEADYYFRDLFAFAHWLINEKGG